MKIARIGLDLAKNVFQLHAVAADGTVLLRKQVKRAQLLTVFARLEREERCVVGMEACGGAHYWARALQALDYDARLMPPKRVKPYALGNKNDRNDADAICEAVAATRLPFVPVRNLQQQEWLTAHRIRERLMKQRVMLINQSRGLLAEYGIVFARNVATFHRQLPLILADANNALGVLARQLLADAYDELQTLEKRLAQLDKTLAQQAMAHADCRRLLHVEGIGPLTATAVVAQLGDAKQFRRGRQLAQWLGIVPGEHSSGGKQHLLGIHCHGNRYLRTLLIHGARAALNAATEQSSKRVKAAKALETRMHKNQAVVAFANKNARLLYAMLRDGSDYRNVS